VGGLRQSSTPLETPRRTPMLLKAQPETWAFSEITPTESNPHHFFLKFLQNLFFIDCGNFHSLYYQNPRIET
jgi:hypothetical protein